MASYESVLVCGLGGLFVSDCHRRDETNDETGDTGGGGGGTVLRSPGQCHLSVSRGGACVRVCASKGAERTDSHQTFPQVTLAVCGAVRCPSVHRAPHCSS